MRPLEWLAGRDRLAVVALPDSSGVAAASSYVETYWLPVIGPSATWALRALAADLHAGPSSGTTVDVDQLSRRLGLGAAAGKHAPVRRTLARLVQFRLARIDEERDVMEVRTVVPPLPERLLAQLPSGLADHHLEPGRVS